MQPLFVYIVATKCSVCFGLGCCPGRQHNNGFQVRILFTLYPKAKWLEAS